MAHPAPPFYRSRRPGRGVGAQRLSDNDYVGQAAASGSITTVAEANLIDGETFTIGDGTSTETFEIDIGGGGVTPGNVAVVIAALATADDVRDAIIGAIAGTTLDITASNGGAALVNLVNNQVGSAGNVTITDTVADAGFIVAGMSGGADPSPKATIQSGRKPNTSVVPLVYTNGVGERTLYETREFVVSPPDLKFD